MDDDGKKKQTGLSDKEHALYLEIRKSLLDAEGDNAKMYDQSVIAIAGGALAVSLAFLKDIVGTGPVQGVAWLGIAWGLFGACILVVLLNLLASQRGHEKFREDLDAAASAGGGRFLERVRKRQQQRRVPGVIEFMNRITMFGLFLGIAALAVFAKKNL